MTTAPYPQVTNELLSAYIDEAVTEEERRLIEQAVAEDADVAWRLESLRATVRLLRELPAMSLPRSFILTPEQVGQTVPALAQASEAVATGVPAAAVPTKPALAKPITPAHRQATKEGSGFWHDLRRGWDRFWQGGSPAMRNAMAASFAVLVVLLIAPRFLANTSFISLGAVETTTATQPQSQTVAQAPSAKQPGAARAEEGAAVKQGAPTAAGEVTGTGASAKAPTAQPQQAQEAAVATAPEQAAAAVPLAQPQDQTAEKAAASSAAPAGDAGVQDGSAPGALAANGEPGAPPGASTGPSMGFPSGSTAVDAAQAASGSMAAAPATGPRSLPGTGPGTEAGAAPAPGAAQVAAPVAAASADLASAYAVTGESEAAGAAADGVPVTGVTVSSETAELLAAADTQGIQTTPVATVAAATEKPAPISTPTEAAEAEAEAETELEAQSKPVTSAAVAVAAGSNSVPAAVQGMADEQAPGTQGGVPAWAGLAIQTAALLAALATLIFAILWWRSRRPVPPA
ncbi:MAG: hypothetical protein U0X20_21380 [Caldilineaceae bacterium]